MDKAAAYKGENIGMLTAIGVLFGLISAVSPGTVFDIILTITAIVLIYRFSDTDEKYFLVKLFIWGLLARVILLLLVRFILMHNDVWFPRFGVRTAYLFPDAGYYTVRSWGIAQHIMGVKMGDAMIGAAYEGYGYSFYLHMMAFFYYLFGFSPISVTVINCIFSALTGIVYYFVAKDISNTRVARIAAAMIVFFPSMMVWSIENLKDPIFIFLMGVVLLAFVRLIKTGRPEYWILFFAAFFLQFLIRSKFFILQSGIALWACFFYLQSKKRLRFSHFFALIICAVITWPFLGPKLVMIKRLLIGYHVGATSPVGFRYRLYDKWVYTGGMDFNLVGNFALLKATLLGWAHFFLEPFPWKIRSALSIASFPQMIIWYMILLFSVIGIFVQLKNNRKMTIPLLVFLLLVGTVFALTGGNVGTSFRMRDMLSPLIIVFSAVGFGHIFRVKGKAKV